MDIFGWVNYVERLENNWRSLVHDGDTVVVAGDISWGTSLEEVLEDFRFIHELPGQKIFLKGNHDYWWSTKTKMDGFLKENGLDSIRILSNNAYQAEGLVICGTRGWIFEKGEPQDKKIAAREAGRLRMSLEAGKKLTGELTVFLHYPPIFAGEQSPEILDLLLEYGVKRCYYGHIHANGCAYALNGEYMGIQFRLVSSDFVEFRPVFIQ